MAVVLRIENLTKDFLTGDHPVRALDGVSLSIEAGQLVAIMGASGSGKSTLLHLAGGLDVPSSGQVLIEGNDLSRLSDRKRTLFRRRRIGIIFQTFNLLPALTARENVAVPLLLEGMASAEIERKLLQTLELVHLKHRMDHRPQAMSGGEQQRVAIARALLNDPALILADEPTGNLDSANAAEIWHLLHRLSHELGKTVLMVTHEPAAASYADAVHVLKDGRIVGTIQHLEPGNAALVAAEYTKLAG